MRSPFALKMERMSLKPEDFKKKPPSSTPDTSVAPGPRVAPGTTLTPDVKLDRFKVREMKLVQDAHTRSEQSLYEVLWEQGTPIDDISRTITIGVVTLARRAGMSETMARLNVRGLMQKMAIEDGGKYDCERAQGRTYRVFNYVEILRRRKAAGLTHFVRKTSAVIFVSPETGQPIPLGKASSTPGLTLTPGPSPAPEPGIRLTGGPGVSLAGAFREVNIENTVRETSSLDISTVVEQLRPYLLIDDDAVRLILGQIRITDPDFRMEEVAHFAAAVAAKISGQGNVKNPVGLLINQVPKFFPGIELSAYRKAKAQERAEQEKTARSVLDDPEATERDREWAVAVLKAG